MAEPVDRPLPALWDGRAVQWWEWTPIAPIFMCDRSKRKNGLTIAPQCAECGVQGRGFSRSLGILDPPEGAVEQGEFLRYGPAGRAIYAQEPAKPMLGLIATRCGACGHDSVFELETEVEWELGPEDYGVLGSVAP